jgi:hypothetical protein
MRRSVTASFENLLPARIDRAEVEVPTLLLSGDQWSLAATCDWKWFDSEGVIISCHEERADAVWDLVGHRILGVTWSSTHVGLDPTFNVEGGSTLELHSDASFDTWTIHTPTLVLVGPLPPDS